MIITGRTRLFVVIGDPVAQVRAPELFNPLFDKRGIDAVLVPVHVTADELPKVWEGFRRMANLGGVLVTVPHKQATLELSDEAGATARLVGAANIVRREPDGRMVCDMFDGAGFVTGLRGEGKAPEGRKVLLLGAGGAASAIAFALADAGVASLTIANRTMAKAEDLARAVGAAFPSVAVAAGPAEPAGHDMVVNATSLGMQPGDPLPVDPDKLLPAMTVAEIIMKPEITPLLAEAGEIGCSLQHGRHMLDGQVQLMSAFLGI